MTTIIITGVFAFLLGGSVGVGLTVLWALKAARDFERSHFVVGEADRTESVWVAISAFTLAALIVAVLADVWGCR